MSRMAGKKIMRFSSVSAHIVYARSNASFAPSFMYELIIASYNHRRFSSNSLDVKGENEFLGMFWDGDIPLLKVV